MHKRTAHRWRLLLTMTVGVFLAFGSFWLLQLITNGDISFKPDQNRGEPDYIVEKFSVVRMTPEGKPRYVIGGDKLTHLPIDDSSEIVNPLVKGVAPGQPPMTIKAQQARVDHANTQVHLRGNVDIERKSTAKTLPMTMKTEALTVFPDEERMVTDQAVDIVVGNNTLSGVGMRANNATGDIAIQSKLRMTLPPRGR
jgi:lipopolysaccharide export system protein LptC